jgi:hypothetical protein
MMVKEHNSNEFSSKTFAARITIKILVAVLEDVVL